LQITSARLWIDHLLIKIFRFFGVGARSDLIVLNLFSTALEFASAVNPFLKRIPHRELDDYKSDYIEEVKKHKKAKMFYDNKQEENICVSYKILVVFAKK
jgi:hypothetical protein